MVCMRSTLSRMTLAPTTLVTTRCRQVFTLFSCFFPSRFISSLCVQCVNVTTLYFFPQAILTHKGRSSNSGHYVAWVKQKGDTWIECNDDDVRPIHEEDIMKLSGGGKTSKE